MSTDCHSPAQATAEQCADCAREHGCDECFEELTRRFQSRLLHFLIRRVGSRHDAEDLLQETFLAAYRHLARYRSSWQFSTWVFTIANRLAVSSKRRRRAGIGGIRPSIEATDKSDPGQEAQDNETRSRLWDAARRILEPDAFTALWLSYVESMSADQVGLALGRSANAVRIMLHRVRAHLEKELESFE